MSAAILDNPLRMANRTQAPFFLLDRVLFIGTYLIRFFQDPKQASQTHVHSERERCGCRQGCRGQNYWAWHFSRWSQVHVSYSMGWVKIWYWQRDVQARIPWRNLAGIALHAKKLIALQLELTSRHHAHRKCVVQEHPQGTNELKAKYWPNIHFWIKDTELSFIKW